MLNPTTGFFELGFNILGLHSSGLGLGDLFINSDFVTLGLN